MDRQRERQTADAMMASAIAVAGREFYWDRFGGQVPPMVCAIGGTTLTQVQVQEVREISRIGEVVFHTCSNRCIPLFGLFLPLAIAKKVELQSSHLADA